MRAAVDDRLRISGGKDLESQSSADTPDQPPCLGRV
jgi:hypothetical protein